MRRVHRAATVDDGVKEYGGGRSRGQPAADRGVHPHHT